MQKKSHSIALPKRHLMVMVLATATVARCSCEDADEFVADGVIEPAALTFENTPVTQRITQTLEVTGNGSAPYRIVAWSVEGDLPPSGANEPPIFEVVVPEELEGAGLPFAETTTITVTYTPCPPAWAGGSLQSDFDFSLCPGTRAVAQLVITDNSPSQAKTISLSGTPVQPPQIEVACPSGIVACGDDSPDLGQCQGLNFGTVNADEEPCDILVEVRNAWRNGVPVGTLNIEDITIEVEDIDTDLITAGEDVGFELLTFPDKMPLNPTPDRPFEVEVPTGSEQAAGRFWIRYKGTQPGAFRGRRANDTGLRMATNDPDVPVSLTPILAEGTAPDVGAFPTFVNFEDRVAVGRTETATISLRNDGNATLRVENIDIVNAGTTTEDPEFSWTTSRGETFPIQISSVTGQNTIDVFIEYAPNDGEADVVLARVFTNDPDEQPFEIELRGGASQKIQVTPSDILEYPIQDPPVREQDIVICNEGGAPLTISQFNFEPLEMESTALDDFSITQPAECSTVPCNVDIVLCPREAPGCVDSCTTVTVLYENNDQSSVDEVNMIISSDDPADREHRLVLRARDVPCRFPLPVIEVTTPTPCVGQPVTVSGANSDPGGRINENDVIEEFQWEWDFAVETPTLMPMEGVTTTFIPSVGGVVYIIALTVKNSCGRESQGAATESILVRDTCP